MQGIRQTFMPIYDEFNSPLWQIETSKRFFSFFFYSFEGHSLAVSD